MTKEAVICKLCRFLIDKEPKDQYIQFGTDELNSIICKHCLKKVIREGVNACLEE